MDATLLTLQPALLLQPKIFRDERGSFQEMYQRSVYQRLGVAPEFVQDNLSFSHKGTVRGMHFQASPGQAKLVSVISGQIYDVIVDIRPDSPTFKQWEGIYLDSESGKQLFVPIGFAHGFCVISSSAHVCYKVSSPYDPIEEKTFRFDDPEIGITWPIDTAILSERDRLSPLFKEIFA